MADNNVTLVSERSDGEQGPIVGPRPDFLRRLISAPGTLCGVDLATGESFAVVRPVDEEEFLRAHLLGPTLAPTPPLIDVTTEAGEQRRTRAYTVTSVLPTGLDGFVSHVSVRFLTSDSLRPSEAIIAASRALHRAGIDHVLERSSSIGRWVFWFTFDEPVDLPRATSLASRVRAIMRQIGIADADCQVPLLDPDASNPRLPFPFFAGNYFGVAHEVLADGSLKALPAPATAEAADTPTGVGSDRAAYVESPEDAADGLDPFLETWCDLFGSTLPARPRHMTEVAKALKIDVPVLAGLAPRAASRTLDRLLLERAERRDGRFQVLYGFIEKRSFYWIRDKLGDD